MKTYTNSKGELHRTDGPAVEYSNGLRYPYLPSAEETLTREIIE